MATPPTEPAGAAVVHQFIGAMNDRDIEGLVDLFTSTATVDVGPRYGPPVAGRAAIHELFELTMRAMTELTLVIQSLFYNRSEVLAVLGIYMRTGSENPDPKRIPEWRGDLRLSWQGAYRFAITADGLIQSLESYSDERSVRVLPVSGGVHRRNGADERNAHGGAASSAKSPPSRAIL